MCGGGAVEGASRARARASLFGRRYLITYLPENSDKRQPSLLWWKQRTARLRRQQTTKGLQIAYLVLSEVTRKNSTSRFAENERRVRVRAASCFTVAGDRSLFASKRTSTICNSNTDDQRPEKKKKRPQATAAPSPNPPSIPHKKTQPSTKTRKTDRRTHGQANTSYLLACAQSKSLCISDTASRPSGATSPPVMMA